MHNYLNKILANKKLEIKQRLDDLEKNKDQPIAKVLAGQNNDYLIKSFRQALLQSPLAIIAEIKRRSPSKAQLAEIIDPVALAKQYVAGGAKAISVLTDFTGFGGSLADLTSVSHFIRQEANAVVLLRKDFILHEIQIAESIVAGANAILLIVSILQERTAELLAAARKMQIDVLVEVHTRKELEYALAIGADMIGVNNRDLRDFSVDLACSRELIQLMPASVVKISESGIDTPETGRALAALGYNALLIGEALVKSTTPEIFISKLCQS